MTRRPDAVLTPGESQRLQDTYLAWKRSESERPTLGDDLADFVATALAVVPRLAALPDPRLTPDAGVPRDGVNGR